MAIDIRLATTKDAAEILAIYAPYCETSTVTFETVSPTREEMAERIVRVMEAFPWLVAESDGRLLGYVYGTRFRERAAYRWTAEVAVYVARNEHRRGIGQALYSSLFSILRVQGYYKVIAGITLPNPASVRLHERMGFRQVGSFPRIGFKGSWLDVGWWQLALMAEISDPAEPRPFPAVQSDQAVLAELHAGRPPAGGRV